MANSLPQNITDLLAFIDANLPDNISGQIDPLDVRTAVKQAVQILNTQFSLMAPTLTAEQEAVWKQLSNFKQSDFYGTLSTSSAIPESVDLWGFAAPGTYPNAGNLTVAENKLGILTRVGTTWSKVEVAMPNSVPTYNSAQSYVAGSTFVHNGVLYQVNVGQTLNVGENPETSSKVNKISAIDYLSIVNNKVINGDFSAGTSGWLFSNATLSTSGAKIIATGNSLLSDFSITQKRDYIDAHTYFYKFRVRVTSSLSTEIDVFLGAGYGRNRTYNPLQNEWYEISGTFKMIGNYNDVSDNIVAKFTSTTDAGNSTMEMEYPVVVDLTEIYGLGNEPSPEEFLSILKNFKNSFFNKADSFVFNQINENVKINNVLKILSDTEKLNDNYPTNYENVKMESIFDGKEDDITAVSGATAVKDELNGLKLIGNVNQPYITKDFSTPLQIDNASVIGLWVWFEDASKITNLQVELYSDAGYTQKWLGVSTNSTQNQIEPLKNGWNYIRWHAHQDNNGSVFKNLTDWGTIYRMRLFAICNAPTTVIIDKVVAETNEKARIIFVEDGSYRTFYDFAYPDLKARNFPVTWALRIVWLGTSGQLTEAEVDQLADENRNSISFHSYGDGINTSAMNARQLRNETVRTIEWLKTKGYTGYKWRAAFLQNEAPASYAIRDLVLACSTTFASLTLGAFPFINRFNTTRIGIHGAIANQSYIDEYFAALKKTRQLGIFYTHGVSNSEGDVTQAQWDYFISKIDEGITEGWLEGTTFEILNEKYKAYK